MRYTSARLARRLLASLAALPLLHACQAPTAHAAAGDTLELPASFIGMLPCHDCPGTRAHLDLWADGTFHLARSLTGKTGRDDELGRWRRAPDRPIILLYGGREMPVQLEVIDPRTLRALDPDGRPAGSGATFDLVSRGHLEPTDVSRGLHGMFHYMADAAQFDECLTGRSYPVAMEGDFVALERAYVALPKAGPGTPVMASFDGDIVQRPPMEGTGTVPTVVVRRYVDLWPGQTCERAMSHASLSPQYWRIVSLRGTTLAPVEGVREAHLILRGTEQGYAASAGCDRLQGEYRVSGREIVFTAPSVVGSCPAPLVERQRALLDVLAAATSWSIQGQGLELFDAAGASIAVLEVVYLR